MAQLKNLSERKDYEHFLSEAFLTATLEHPNIIPLYDTGLNDKLEPYFTMKLIEGKNLKEHISQAKNESLEAYTIQDLLDLFLKVCDAIAFAHSKNIIHLDIKPENIRLGHYGEVLVCDWGIAKIIEDDNYSHDSRIDLDPNIINDHTLDGTIKGTIGYMAPEQIDTSLASKNKQTDIYQLGGILYSLLTLKKPLTGATLEEAMNKTISGDIMPATQVKNPYFKIPEALNAVAMKALSTEQHLRYSSVPELREDILQWREGFATSAENASFLRSFFLLLKRHRVIASLLFIFLLLSTLFIYEIRYNELQAIQNAELALANEQKAIQALALYQQQKQQTEKAGVEASPRLTQVGIDDLTLGRFVSARKNLLRARELDPNNDLPLYFLAILQFAEQDFDAMIQTLKTKRFLTKDTQQLLKLVRQYQKIKSPRHRLSFKQLISLIHELPFTRPSYLIALHHHQTHPPLHEKIALIKLLFAKTNPHISKWNIKIENLAHGYNIDLSNNPYIRSFEALHGLPINKLNLQNSLLTDAELVTKLIVKEIDIRNTNIRKLGLLLAMENLRSLTLSKHTHIHWNFLHYPRVTVSRK